MPGKTVPGHYLPGQIPAIYTNANKAAPWRARHVFAVTWVSFRRKLTGINCRDAIYTRFPWLRYRSGPPCGGLACGNHSNRA